MIWWVRVLVFFIVIWVIFSCFSVFLAIALHIQKYLSASFPFTVKPTLLPKKTALDCCIQYILVTEEQFAWLATVAFHHNPHSNLTQVGRKCALCAESITVRIGSCTACLGFDIPYPLAYSDPLGTFEIEVQGVRPTYQTNHCILMEENLRVLASL